MSAHGACHQINDYSKGGLSRLLLVDSEVVQNGLKDLTDSMKVLEEAAGAAPGQLDER